MKQRGAGGASTGVLSDFVTSSQVVFLDVADATKTDTNAIVSAESTAAGITTFTMSHPSTGAMERIDNGACVYSWPLVDRLGQSITTGANVGQVLTGVTVTTQPGDTSAVAITIGTRIVGTTIWSSYGIAHLTSNRYGLTLRNASSTLSVAVSTASAGIGQTIITPNQYVGHYGSLYAAGVYNRQADTPVQSGASTTTALELVVIVGYRATPGLAGPHTLGVKLWYEQPWAWTSNTGVL